MSMPMVTFHAAASNGTGFHLDEGTGMTAAVVQFQPVSAFVKAVRELGCPRDTAWPRWLAENEGTLDRIELAKLLILAQAAGEAVPR
jgi:hypothetical protein